MPLELTLLGVVPSLHSENRSTSHVPRTAVLARVDVDGDDFAADEGAFSQWCDEQMEAEDRCKADSVSRMMFRVKHASFVGMIMQGQQSKRQKSRR